MSRRQWIKVYADTLQMRGLWTRREANRAAEEAAESYGHMAPERVAMAAIPTHLEPTPNREERGL